MQNLKMKVMMLWVTLTCLLSLSGVAMADVVPLPPEQAFVFSASVSTPTDIHAQWKIAPGYYLYVKRMHFTFQPTTTATVHLPQGEIRYDQARGNFEAYAGNLSIPVIVKTTQKMITMGVDYQGCSQYGFCYPPIHKNMAINLVTGMITEISTPITPTFSAVNLQHLLTDQSGVSSLFYTQHLVVMLLIFAGLGLLLAFTPCVLPMIPIITGIIVGQKQAVGTRKAFLLSSTYVLGMASAYAIAGVVAALFGNSIQIWLQKPVVIALVSGLFVLLAFSIFELFELRFLRHWQQRVVSWNNRHQGGAYVGVFLMGVLSTLLISPCVTAPLVGVLIYIGDTGSPLLGASALFAMGLGMGLPLLLIGSSASKWLPKTGSWMEAVRKSFGMLMLAMAIWLSSRILPSTITMVLWGTLVVVIAFFIGWYLPRHVGRHQFNRGLGFLVGLLGVVIMFSGVGTLNMITSMANKHQTLATQESFIIVHTVAELNAQLANARAADRPVMLDFYADWCASCVEMDKHVFNVPDVKQALGHFVLLRADLSGNTADDDAIMKQYDIVAPPTVLFFSTTGDEINSRRVVGEVSANEFLSRVNLFMAASCDKKVQC